MSDLKDELQGHVGWARHNQAPWSAHDAHPPHAPWSDFLGRRDRDRGESRTGHNVARVGRVAETADMCRLAQKSSTSRRWAWTQKPWTESRRHQPGRRRLPRTCRLVSRARAATTLPWPMLVRESLGNGSRDKTLGHAYVHREPRRTMLPSPRQATISSCDDLPRGVSAGAWDARDGNVAPARRPGGRG